MKSHLRKSKASCSTIRRIERIVRQGSRAVRRSVSAFDRRRMKGGASAC